jgi:hypothetical protein
MDKAPPQRSRYVRRVDLPDRQLVGWHVHYQRGREQVSRFFADQAHGGPNGAHAEALRFAAEREQDGGELALLLRRLSPRSDTRSGIPGVTRLVRRPPDHGAYWVAYWNDDLGRKVQKKFSVALHGEDVARELAIEARRQATERHRTRLAELLGEVAADRIG